MVADVAIKVLNVFSHSLPMIALSMTLPNKKFEIATPETMIVVACEGREKDT